MNTSSVQHGREPRVCAESDPVAYRSWRCELRRSLAAGAALASLAAVSGCDEDTVVGGAPIPAPIPTPSDAHLSSIGQDSGTTPDASVTPTPNSSLQPYPLESVTCGPPDAGPYYGPGCCFQAHCYAPSDGAACKSASELTLAEVDELRPRHASIDFCACFPESGHLIEGPFARNPAHPNDSARDPADTCCYVLGTGECYGRPFVVEGLGRIAPLAARADWNLFT